MWRRTISAWGAVAALVVGVSACDRSVASPATSAAQPATTVAEPAATTPSTEAPASTAPPTTAPVRDITALPGLLDTSDQPVALDPAVRTGTLDNGLTYLVRYNDQPGSKVSLRLVVKAGSANELGDETGVAHFLEHMLFNGTEEYPENELIDVLREFGAQFGPDVNAYTSYDETVYELDVPNDRESVEAAVDVLYQWLTAAALDEQAVVAERGVVLDEWRSSTQTVEGRLYSVASEHFLAGTPYEGRDPIGSAASIEAMDGEVLRRFYDAWYRPDNAAVVIVGDIDVDDVAHLVADQFGDATPRGDAGVRVDTTMPPFADPGFVLHADPDQTTVDVEVTLPLAAMIGTGTAALRATLLDQVAFEVLVRRLARDAAGGEAPFDDVVLGSNSWVDALDAPALYAITDAERSDETLVALLDEYERALRFGFDPAEVDTAVASLRSQIDAAFGPDREAQDFEIADQLVEFFLRDDPLPARDEMFALANAELDAITPEAVAARFAARYTNTAPQVIVSAPEQQAAEVPDEATVLAAIAAAPDRELEPRDDAAALPDTLMARPDPIAPEADRRMSDDDWPVFDPIEYSYPSGARVILIPNDISQGELYFQATSPGGLAMLAGDDVIDGLFTAEIMAASGAGEFGPADLAEAVAGYDVELEPELNTYTEGWSGRAATSDAEALLQLVHLRMTANEPDPVAMRRIVQQYQPIVDDPSTDPDLASSDALNEARYGDAPHYDVVPTPDEFATLDAEGVGRVWADRFGDASDFVFVLAGDFERAEMEQLADAYLGTLPGSRGAEQPPDVTPPPPTGPVTIDVHAGTGDTANLQLLFTTPAERVHPADDALVDVATSVIESRLTSVVREEFGDSYSPFAVGWVDLDPSPVVLTYVYASGSPSRIEAISDTIRAELADLAQNGPTEAEFRTAYAPVVERYNFVDNGEFMREALRAAADTGYDLTDYVYKHEAIDDVTRQAVQGFLAEHVPAAAYAQAIVTPR